MMAVSLVIGLSFDLLVYMATGILLAILTAISMQIDEKKKINYAISGVLTPNKEWFTVSRNDGNLCVIEVIRNKIPTGASIELGLKNLEGKITLKFLR